MEETPLPPDPDPGMNPVCTFSSSIVSSIDSVVTCQSRVAAETTIISCAPSDAPQSSQYVSITVSADSTASAQLKSSPVSVSEDVTMHDVTESPGASSMISRRSSSPSVASSNLDSMRSMTASMSKLSMIQPKEIEPAVGSPQTPPATVKRAAPASHQSPPGDLPTRGTQGAPQHSRGSRVSSRGRGPFTMKMVSSSSTAGTSSPPSSSSRGAPSRGASSRNTSSRGASLRGRGAKRARQYPPGPLPQLEAASSNTS
ncbi:unnamed protein product [Haemonchus placei]|uniref:Flocculation protein FLO11-like n=1 Tax=Haemonchus placei TaxID=6290 RepID=A0A0N4W8K4_HAEPC|nr:unnamed protein product [Haemonchus placei]